MKTLLKTWLWMLALSLAVGLAIGTCVRRESERPATYIGEASPTRLDAGCGSRAIASSADSLSGSSAASS